VDHYSTAVVGYCYHLPREEEACCAVAAVVVVVDVLPEVESFPKLQSAWRTLGKLLEEGHRTTRERQSLLLLLLLLEEDYHRW
jgi:hypothetical protein